MKKIILSVITLIWLFTATAGEKVDAKIEASFKSEFPGAQYATWEKIEHSDLYNVRFVFNNESLLAFFDTDGVFIAVVRVVKWEQLPPIVKKNIKEISGNNEVVKAEELTLLGQTSYLFAVRKNEVVKFYQAHTNGNITLIKSVRSLLRSRAAY